jgi:hypothetical protein
MSKYAKDKVGSKRKLIPVEKDEVTLDEDSPEEHKNTKGKAVARDSKRTREDAVEKDVVSHREDDLLKEHTKYLKQAVLDEVKMILQKEVGSPKSNEETNELLKEVKEILRHKKDEDRDTKAAEEKETLTEHLKATLQSMQQASSAGQQSENEALLTWDTSESSSVKTIADRYMKAEVRAAMSISCSCACY